MNKPAKETYSVLIDRIGKILQEGRKQVAYAVNYQMVISYWEIGRHIVEFEQNGEKKAEYGAELLTSLAKDLSKRYGKGFSKSNLFNFRKFYLQFEIFQTLSGKLTSVKEGEIFQTPSGKLGIKIRDEKCETLSHILSWSHYCELLKLDDPLEINFYSNQVLRENWSVRELRRQINSGLF
ncbi:MAG: DUF1016 N-terminal domain-containing protein, partial [Bacteroidales bacterium]|nr:DUF1016 N-terminal domain-containing protein [Bacteroidales bacterium]